MTDYADLLARLDMLSWREDLFPVTNAANVAIRELQTKHKNLQGQYQQLLTDATRCCKMAEESNKCTEKAEAERDALEKECDRQTSINIQLVLRYAIDIAELRIDAERYRWLLACGTEDAGFLHVPICNWNDVIDARRAEKGK